MVVVQCLSKATYLSNPPTQHIPYLWCSASCQTNSSHKTVVITSQLNFAPAIRTSSAFKHELTRSAWLVVSSGRFCWRIMLLWFKSWITRAWLMTLPAAFTRAQTLWVLTTKFLFICASIAQSFCEFDLALSWPPGCQEIYTVLLLLLNGINEYSKIATSISPPLQYPKKFFASPSTGSQMSG